MIKNRLTINLGASLAAFGVSFVISFLLTPYIINNIGSEAYGFIGLANSFINFASLVTIAINSMAGRFITIKLYQNDVIGVNKYFTTLFFSNVIVSLILSLPTALCILYLNKLLDIPSEIQKDVQILLSFLFFSFVINTVGSAFAVATFTRNRLELSSLRNIESNFIRLVILLGLFYCFVPSVSYIGITTFVAAVYILITNIYYTKKLLPEVKINKRYFDYKAILELLSSGVWNTVVRLGQLLLDGLDLLLANLYLGAAAMGTLALAKTVPLFITTTMGVFAGVFMPQFTILFAQNDHDGLIISVKKSMKIMSVILSLPISLLVVFGDIFYSLWVPNEDSTYLQILSIITVATTIIAGSINCIYNIFTVTNKLKANALWVIASGFLNIILVLMLLETTSYGLYIVAGVSTIISIIRNLAFTVPYGAKYLNVRWTTFYPEILKSILCVIVVTMLGLLLRYFINVESWFGLLLSCGLIGLLGLVSNCLLILNKNERMNIINVVKTLGK